MKYVISLGDIGFKELDVSFSFDFGDIVIDGIYIDGEKVTGYIGVAIAEMLADDNDFRLEANEHIF